MYTVRVKKKSGIRQRFHVVIEAGNGEPLFSSENLVDVGYARKLAEQTALALTGPGDSTRVVDETGSVRRGFKDA